MQVRVRAAFERRVAQGRDPRAQPLELERFLGAWWNRLAATTAILAATWSGLGLGLGLRLGLGLGLRLGSGAALGLGAGFGLGAGLGLVLVLGLGLAPPLPASLRRGSPLPASAAALFLREEAVAPTRLLMTSRVATAASLVGGSGRAIIRSRFLPTRPVASEADSSDSAPPSSPAMEVRAEAT